MTSAGQAGYALTFGFDALGRLTTQTSPRGRNILARSEKAFKFL
jgi:hypothetical protein